MQGKLDSLQQESHQHDYALFRLKREVIQPEYFYLEKGEIEIDCEATVSGFAANIVKGGAMNFILFSHSGQIKEVKEGSIYYNIDTESMQSGSPVIVKKEGKFGVAGIHKGYGGETKKLNVATRITPAMIRQIEVWTQQMGVAYKNERPLLNEIDRLTCLLTEKDKLLKDREKKIEEMVQQS